MRDVGTIVSPWYGTKTACGRERRKDPQKERQCGRKRRSRSRLNSASFARCVSPPSSYLARALVLSFSHSFSLHSEHPSSVSRDEVKHLAGHSQLKLPRYWISLFPANGKPGATTTHSRTRALACRVERCAPAFAEEAEEAERRRASRGIPRKDRIAKAVKLFDCLHRRRSQELSL